MTIWTLGTDPGSDSGAAVLLEGERRVLAWWTWQLMDRKGGDVYRVTEVGRLPNVHVVELGRMWEIAARIREQMTGSICAFCLEGLFVARVRRPRKLRPGEKKKRQVNPQSVIPLAESAGEFIGGLRKTPDYRPLATEWRPLVLGRDCPKDGKEAEAYAVKMAGVLFDWPKGKPPTKAERGALAEGACIARCGYIQQTALSRWAHV